MLTIQPKDDAFCTVKCKAKHNRRRDAMECWYECSKWAGVIAQDMTDLDEVTEPQFDILAEDVPTFCPKCGSLLMY